MNQMLDDAGRYCHGTGSVDPSIWSVFEAHLITRQQRTLCNVAVDRTVEIANIP